MTTAAPSQKRSPVGFAFFWPVKRRSWQAPKATDRKTKEKKESSLIDWIPA